jgi:hypothetical protein
VDRDCCSRKQVGRIKSSCAGLRGEMPPARGKAPDPHFQAAAVDDTLTSPVGSLDGKRPVRGLHLSRSLLWGPGVFAASAGRS